MRVAITPLGEIHELDSSHVAGWNAIADDPQVGSDLNLQEAHASHLEPSPEADLLNALKTNSSAHRRFVFLGGANAGVLAAIELKSLPCREDDPCRGVSVDIAVLEEARGKGIGQSILEAVDRWANERLGDCHVFADVCESNTASTTMARRCGMHATSVGDPCGLYGRPGHDDCQNRSTRYCFHSSH